MLRYMTAGESHGESLVAILDGVPAGLRLDSGGKEIITRELAKRMHGYGRGGRMEIETAGNFKILSGIRNEVTIGSPIGIEIPNKDFKIDSLPEIKSPRPGHADLAGMQKYALKEARSVLERASARETAAKTALGAIARILLLEFGIEVLSHVTMIGSVKANTKHLSFDEILELSDVSKSPVRCADKKAEKKMCNEIDKAKKRGDTLGGVFEVIARAVPPGLGSYIQWDRRLDGELARQIMSIPAVKAVSIGEGIECASLAGSKTHDPIGYDTEKKSFKRALNNAGGIEGGISNGEQIVVKGFMKPIATLAKPLASVNVDDKSESFAVTERADVSAVAACGVIAEAAMSLTLAWAFMDKFGSDSVREIRRNYDGYTEQLKSM
ncbi:MAG: chorismate synthase [Candidatus Omnitrophica bacterium]|nr:chorismate synthase [Candidatus Omnitrophota bacterium]